MYHILCFVYLLFHEWTLRLLPCFSFIVKNAFTDMGIQIFLQDLSFNSFGYTGFFFFFKYSLGIDSRTLLDTKILECLNIVNPQYLQIQKPWIQRADWIYRSRIAGSYEITFLILRGNCHNISHNDYTISHFDQQCTVVLVSPQPCQHLFPVFVFSLYFFFNSSHFNEYKMVATLLFRIFCLLTFGCTWSSLLHAVSLQL